MSSQLIMEGTEHTDEIRIPEPPTAFDTCDVCGFRAYGIITVLSYNEKTYEVTDHGDLMFCGHHLRKQITHAEDRLFPVYDYTSDLDA